MVWYGIGRVLCQSVGEYGMVWYGIVWYGMRRCHIRVWYGMRCLSVQEFPDEASSS